MCSGNGLSRKATILYSSGGFGVRGLGVMVGGVVWFGVSVGIESFSFMVCFLFAASNQETALAKE
jgi:hypothetical protein